MCGVADSMCAWGLSEYYDTADPYEALYEYCIEQIAPQYGWGGLPAGLQTGPGGYTFVCKNNTGYIAIRVFTNMCLRIRGILWAESKIGDCGSPSLPNMSSIQTVNLAAGLGLSAASDLTSSLLAVGDISQEEAGAVEAAVPVVGSLVSIVDTIFAKHAKKIQQEEQINCEATAAATEAIQRIYSGFASGSYTAAQAYEAMQEIQAQFKQITAPVTKSGNGAYDLNGIMAVHALLASYLFGIAPIPASVSASAIGQSSSPIGQVPVAAGAVAGAAVGAAGVPSLTSIPVWVIILAIGVIVLAFL